MSRPEGPWFHGGRLAGPIEILPQTAKQAQHGPGFYITRSRSRASQYGKGSKTVYRITLREPVAWMGYQRLPVSSMRAWASTHVRGQKLREVLEALDLAATRQGSDVLALSLLNTMVNAGAIGRSNSVQLASWYARHGIEGNKFRHAGQTWAVLFTPAAVAGYRKATDQDGWGED